MDGNFDENEPTPYDETSNTLKMPVWLKNYVKPSTIFGALFFIGAFYVYDKCSGNAEDRFSDKENKRIAQLVLPSEFQSYEYIESVTSTDSYEIEKMDSHISRSYYSLPDKTLVVEGRGGFVRIDTDGKIIDYLESSDLSFYGSTLAKYDVFYPPVIESDETSSRTKYSTIKTSESKPTLKGSYTNWPTNGDTTLYPMEPLSKIVPNSRKMIDACDRADVVQSIWGKSGELDPAGTILLIDGVWYITDYTFHKSNKTMLLYTDSQPTQLNMLGGILVKHKQPSYYDRARSGAFVTGGAASGGNRASWSGDTYVELMIGKTRVPLKVRYREDEQSKSPKSYFSVLHMGKYAIVDGHIVREK